MYRASMPGPGDEPLDLLLDAETVFDGGFGTIPHMYPVTIVQSRYGGAYEGGFGGSCNWLAFPVHPWKLNGEDSPWNGWNGSDIECMQWWDRARERGVPIGRSGTPDGALRNLLEQVATAAGADLDAMFQPPTFNRDELHRRDL
jgi:hypothetical protein